MTLSLLQRARLRAAFAALVAALLLNACAGGADDPGVVIDEDPPAGLVGDNDTGADPDLSVDSGANTGADTGGDKALSGALPPSGNFDLSHWKLTLPSGGEVSTVELNSGYALADVFYTDARTGGMVFRCPNLSGTTANSKYSRAELREMLAPGGSASAPENNWTTSEGGVLRARLRIDRVSTSGDAKKVGRVIIGQIHGEGAEVIRLYYHKRPGEQTGRIYAGMDTAANVNMWSPDIIGNRNGEGIALRERFTYEIRLAGLTLTVKIVRASGAVTTYVKSIDPAYAGTKLYFKAGVYNQNNTGDADDYVQATFFALRQRHP